MKKTLNIGLFLAIALLIFVGCKSKKTPIKPENLSQYTAQQVLDKQPNFASMNISKMDVQMAYGQHQLTFHATVKMLTDSVLAISIQPMLGVEMFRVVFTPTEFIVVDKWNRRYTQNSYEFLRLKLGIDFKFSLLQSIFSNQLFLLDKMPEANDFTFESIEGEPSRLLHLAAGLIQRFELVEPMSISKAEILLDGARLTCNYGEHKMANGVRFPTTFSMLVVAGNRSLSLDCKVNKIEFNKPIEFQKINLDKYEKVSFSKIIP